jgi:hypothetical protein
VSLTPATFPKEKDITKARRYTKTTKPLLGVGVFFVVLCDFVKKERGTNKRAEQRRGRIARIRPQESLSI